VRVDVVTVALGLAVGGAGHGGAHQRRLDRAARLRAGAAAVSSAVGFGHPGAVDDVDSPVAA